MQLSWLFNTLPQAFIGSSCCLCFLLYSANTGSEATRCFAAGQYVSQMQRIHGIDFVYHPPPRNVVPHAAALQSLQTRSATGTPATLSLLSAESKRPKKPSLDHYVTGYIQA